MDQKKKTLAGAMDQDLRRGPRTTCAVVLLGVTVLGSVHRRYRDDLALIRDDTAVLIRLAGHGAGGIELNRASLAELADLPEVGPDLAAAIGAYRARRPLRAPRDLLLVPGFGQNRLRAVERFVRVEPP